jgi:lipopolysaccharide export system permease protein
MLRRLDRYLLARTLPPMTGVLVSTMLAFLMERLLRSFDLLAQTPHGFQFLVQLTVNLTPHYLGLILPGGFFIGLFVVVNRLNNGSEIDALLASGVSLGRIATPLVCLGLTFAMVSVLLYGFVQPYSRYAYRAVMHAAAHAGWNGEVQSQAVLSPSPDLMLTAEEVDPTGRSLDRVFIRRIAEDGREDVLTAGHAELRRNADNRTVTFVLRNGQQLSIPQGGTPRLLSFSLLSVRLPLAPTEKLLRGRGATENELTLVELAQQGFGREEPVLLPRQALQAELFSRLSRALTLPLMPLLAVPFGLTAKRAGSAPAMAVAGVLLFAYQTSQIFAQGLVEKGHLKAATAIGWPTGVFVALCVGTWLLSRDRPGENPVNWIAERISDVIAALLPRRREDDDGVDPRDRRFRSAP